MDERMVGQIKFIVRHSIGGSLSANHFAWIHLPPAL